MTESLPIPSRGPRVVVSTSWDDDDRSGLKLAHMLQAYGIPGTFYVPTANLGQGNAFSIADLRSLSADGFEIGAHTVTHPVLTQIDGSQLDFEIGHCKQALQQGLGQEVTTFCYPRGRFNAAVIAAVRNAGYRGARGTLMLRTQRDFSPFAIPTTLQAYPHRRANYLRNLIRHRAGLTLLRNFADLLHYENWLQLGRQTFDDVRRTGGVWHLYGHPWEIAKLNLWGQLEELLGYVGTRSQVTYLTNAALIDLQTQRKDAAKPEEDRATTFAH